MILFSISGNLFIRKMLLSGRSVTTALLLAEYYSVMEGGFTPKFMNLLTFVLYGNSSYIFKDFMIILLCYY